MSLLVEREIVSSEFGSVVDAVAEQANAFGIGPPQITLRLRPFHPERSLIAIPAISQEKRYRRLIVREIIPRIRWASVSTTD